MKILFLNSTDCRGGAAKAAVRILDAVRNSGVDAEMLAQERRLTGVEPSVMEKLYLWLRPRIDSLPVLKYCQRSGMIFSPSRLPERIAKKIERLKPDLIHLHWIQEGFVKIETLPNLNLPIVWTLHDSWPFTGGCHLPYDCVRFMNSCGACPVLASRVDNDLSRMVWLRKWHAWKDVRFTIVAPSRWLAEKAATSSLFRNMRIEVIPNCIDTSIFHRHDTEKWRRAFDVKPNKRVIILNASQMAHDPNKGEDLMSTILSGIAKLPAAGNIHLLIVGTGFSHNLVPDGLSVSYAGQVSSEARMAELYSASDLLIVTSRSENLSNTVMEGMACGVPSVAFNVGGMSDLIQDGENGCLVSPFDTDRFINAVSWCLDSGRLPELSANAVDSANSRYANSSVAERYTTLYKNVLDSFYGEASQCQR